MSYFAEPYTQSKKKKKEVELDLSNYTIKSDLKGVTGIDTSSLIKTFIYLT